MRVNSRRLQPFGGNLLGRRYTPKPIDAGTRLRNHRMVSNLLSLYSDYCLHIHDPVYVTPETSYLT
jgi:hypothetical protein